MLISNVNCDWSLRYKLIVIEERIGIIPTNSSFNSSMYSANKAEREFAKHRAPNQGRKTKVGCSNKRTRDGSVTSVP